MAASDITTGIIDASSGFGSGGTIQLTSSAGAINASDLTAFGNSGGDISVNAATMITTGQIDASGSVDNGGDVMLDSTGDIQVDSIDARGGPNGIGGNVDISTNRFFRATGSIPQNVPLASISTAGGGGDGTITIRHGGNGVTPFTG